MRRSLTSLRTGLLGLHPPSFTQPHQKVKYEIFLPLLTFQCQTKESPAILWTISDRLLRRERSTSLFTISLRLPTDPGIELNARQTDRISGKASNMSGWNVKDSRSYTRALNSGAYVRSPVSGQRVKHSWKPKGQRKVYVFFFNSNHLFVRIGWRRFLASMRTPGLVQKSQLALFKPCGLLAYHGKKLQM